jgi:hypothetical protein
VGELAHHRVQILLEDRLHLRLVAEEEEVAAADARDLHSELAAELDSDSDRGEADAPARGGLGHAHEAFRVGGADIGLLVGEQHQPGDTAELALAGEGGGVADLEPLLHVGRALALDGVDRGERRLAAAAGDRGRRQMDVRGVAVEDDRQLVAVAHLADHLAKALADQLERLARHRARLVDHRDEVERPARPGRRLDVGGEGQPDEHPVLRPRRKGGGHGLGGEAEELGAGPVGGERDVVLSHQPFDAERFGPGHVAFLGDRAEVADVLHPALAHAHARDGDGVIFVLRRRGFLFLLGDGSHFLGSQRVRGGSRNQRGDQEGGGGAGGHCTSPSWETPTYSFF